MRIFGLQVPFTGEKALNAIDSRGGWYRIMESFAGAWQTGVEVSAIEASTYHANFACKTLIARDIAKLRVKLVQRDSDGVWSETTNPAFSPVLRKPNPFQTHNQYWETYFLSKLSRGNVYVLKQYDNRNVVVGLFVLEPSRVAPLVADDGSVFYQLSADKLSGLPEQVTVPARFIIHDRMNCLFHPLCGVPPIYASALASMQGINIQNLSALLFKNNARPGGVLSAPGNIDDATAARVKAHFEQQYGGDNFGRVAVLGSGLKYEPMAFTAVEGQLIEQLKLTAEIVASTYHMPKYKIGIGDFPPYGNIQAANTEYYQECLQSLIEEAEECLDDGLGIGWDKGIGTEFDIDNLLRMDSVTQMSVLKEAIGSAVMAPNEARKKIDLKPVAGGDSPYLQQQNYSLEALAKRDAKDDPFGTAQPKAQSQEVPDKGDDEIIDEVAAAFGAFELKSQLDRIAA